MKELNYYISKAENMLDSLGIEYHPNIKYGTYKNKNNWARCKWINKYINCSGKGEYYDWLNNRDYFIDINEKLLENGSDEGILNTIIHEMLHSVIGADNHGVTWKRLAEKVNDKYGINIKRCNTAEEKGINYNNLITRSSRVNSFKYQIKCTCCNNYWNRTKATNVTKHPENYHCPCGGKLVVYKL